MSQVIQVPNEDVTFLVEPDVRLTADETYRGVVTVTRAGSNIPIEYECEHEWRTRADAAADAEALAKRLARALKRPSGY